MRLGHLNSVPYLQLQHAETLLASGDYKVFHEVANLPEFTYGSFEGYHDDGERSKLTTNFKLLKILSQPATQINGLKTLGFVVDGLVPETDERSVVTFGSTEVRCIPRPDTRHS